MAKTPFVVLTGHKELDRKLKDFERKAGNRIAKSALASGLRVAKKAITKLAPDWMKETIGARNDRNKKTNQINAKVGVNVGKSKKTKKNGWAPVGVLGTALRIRKTLGGRFAGIANPTQEQLSTGAMKANPIVKAGMAQASGAIKAAMHKAFNRTLEREVAKANLK